MRSLGLYLLLLCACVSLAQHDTYGKTEAQILAMGQDKWERFYAAKAGNSTTAMTEMKDIFGEAVKHRNDRLLVKAAPAIQKNIKSLRQDMEGFAQSAVDLGYNVSGGGTLWTPVSAGITADLELALYPILGGRAKRAAHVTASAIGAQLEKVRKAAVGAHGTPGFDMKRVKIDYARMRMSAARIEMGAKRLSRANSDRVLGFVRTYAHLAIGDFS